MTPLCCVHLPRVFRSPASPWQGDPLAPLPAVEPVTPPWLLPPLAPPRAVVLTASPGSTRVSRHSACATDFWVFSCVSSLHPFGFARPCRGLHEGSPLWLSASRSICSSAPPKSPPQSVVPLVLPGLHHGSSLPQLCRGPSSWLCSRFSPVSSYHHRHPSFSHHHILLCPTLHKPLILLLALVPLSWTH